MVNPNVKNIFTVKNKIINNIMKYLNNLDFLEVNKT